MGYELRDYQLEAIEVIKNLNYGEVGLISLPTASGKGVLLSHLASQEEGRTLIVLPSKELREDMLTKLHNIDENLSVGSVQGRLDEIDCKVCICTRQSLTHKKSTRISRMLQHGNFTQIIFDECLVGDTYIIKNDGGFDYIKNIKNNDNILGGKVTNSFNRESQIWEIEHGCGILKGSPTHSTYIVPYSKFISRNNNFKEEDLVEVKLKDIKTNDFIPVLRKIPHTTKYNWSPEQLSFISLIQADGHLDLKGNRIKINVTKDKDWYEEIFTKGANAFGVTDIFKSFDCRNNLTMWTKDKKLKEILETVFDIPRGKKSNNIKINEQIQYSSLESIKSYIEVLFNCEGDLSKVGNSFRLSLGMCSKDFVIGLSLLLRKFEIISNFQFIDRKAQKHNHIYRIGIGSHELNCFYKKFKLLNRKTPSYENYGSEKLSGYDMGKYKLIKVKKSFLTDKIENVYDFTTTTHTFIANGVLTHNCHQAVNQIKTILEKLDISNSRVFGLTATPYNPSMTDVFNKINYSKDILWMINNKYLCEPRAIRIDTKTDLSDVKTVAGEFNQGQLEEKVNTSYRNDLVVKSYIKYANDRQRTLVFCSGIEHSNDLSEEFNKQGISCKSIDSSLSSDERENILREFKEGKFKVLCNVSVLTTGFDYNKLDCILNTRPLKSKILFVQILGRGLRLCENKEDCLFVDFKDILKHHDLMSMEDIFGIELNNGESVTEAQQRIKDEEEAEKLKRQKEKERIEAERIRQEQLIAEQIRLFNTNIFKAFQDAYYDWYEIINDNMYAVSESSDTHYIIHKVDDEFSIYKVNTNKDNRNIELLNTINNIHEAISFIDSTLENPKSFAYRGCKWKKELATESQKRWAKYARTKFDAHIYFTSYNIKKMVLAFEQEQDKNECE